MRRAADLLIQTLQSLGTEHLFSLSGNQIMPVFDAWIDSNLQLIHTRHEAAAVHMADAWGRLTGRPGIALLTAGPGHANALSALYVALMAESPLVLLSGQAPLKGRGHGSFQEMSQVELAAPVTKAAWMVRDPERIDREMRTAYRLAASGRPGPVYLGLPMDVLEATVEKTEPAEIVAGNEIDNTQPGPDLAGKIMEVLAVARRPMLLAGPALMRSARFQEAVLVCADKGLPLIDMESPRGIFDPSLGAFAEVLARADCLILLGKKLDFTLQQGQSPFLSNQAGLMQIDPDAAVLELTRKNAGERSLLGLEQANPEQVLNEMLHRIHNQSSAGSQWSDEVRQALVYQPQEWSTWRSDHGEALYAVEVGQAIESFLKASEDSVFISDGGAFGQWMQAGVRAPRRVINGPSGAIGSAVPFALAARLAFPSARIAACCGDGAFGYHALEFDTAVRSQLPFVFVIGNDARWNAEYQIQLKNYGQERIKGCELLPTAYHEAVQALGGWGRQAHSTAALAGALESAEASGLPACINVPIRGEDAPLITRSG